MNTDIARGWILANLIALVVGAVLALADYLARSMLAIGNPATTSTAILVYLALAVILSAAYLAIYARLTGAVLAFLVPAFPHSTWLRLHLAIGVVMGVGVGLGMLTPSSEEPLQLDTTAELIFLFCVFSIGGGLLGFVVGGLQALVLRAAVQGLRLWLALSAFGGGIMGALLLILVIWAPEHGGFLGEALLQATIVLGGILGAVVMLPAVVRLRPLATGH